MGMFDYVVCKMPLPEPAAPLGTQFQTKDTEAQYLETYRIESDGSLIHEALDYEWDSERNEDGSVKTIAGALKRVNRRDMVIPYHGDIYFYGSNDITNERWEYSARFTDGKCVRISMIEHEDPTDEAVIYESPAPTEFENKEHWEMRVLSDLANLGIPVLDGGKRLNCRAHQTRRDDGSFRIVVRKSDCRAPRPEAPAEEGRTTAARGGGFDDDGR